MSTAFLYARTTPTEHGENYRPDCDRCGITLTMDEISMCLDCAYFTRGQRRARRG